MAHADSATSLKACMCPPAAVGRYRRGHHYFLSHLSSLCLSGFMGGSAAEAPLMKRQMALTRTRTVYVTHCLSHHEERCNSFTHYRSSSLHISLSPTLARTSHPHPSTYTCPPHEFYRILYLFRPAFRFPLHQRGPSCYTRKQLQLDKSHDELQEQTPGSAQLPQCD